MLQPQVAHTTLAAALAEDPRTLVLGDSLNPLEIVFHARITYVTANANANTGKIRIATGGVTYIAGSRASQISVAGFSQLAAGNVSVSAAPTNYTAEVGNVESHLEGIDDALGLTVTAGEALEVTTAGQGLTLKSPDGTRYVVTVANGGTLAVTAA